MNVYAGVGSRRTPKYVLALMVETARELAARDWLLRTGGAEGADASWLTGCVEHPRGAYELYLPWPGFTGQGLPMLVEPRPEAFEIAARYHPTWETLDASAKALHARNAHIVLGMDLRSPVRMLCCWTSGGTYDGQGRWEGGTGMALRILAGEAPGTRVVNLKREADRDALRAFVGAVAA